MNKKKNERTKKEQTNEGTKEKKKNKQTKKEQTNEKKNE